MTKKIALVTLVLMSAFAASALAVTKGTGIYAIQLGSGTADLYDPSSAGTSGYISAYDHSELNVQGQYWRMLSDDYAFALSGGVGFFTEENEPGTAASPGDPTSKYTQSSFHIRAGGDRVANVGPRAILYFGPGFEYWSGKAKFEGFGGPTRETENVTRISLAGRMGGMMLIGPTWGMTGDIGHKIGIASAEDQGAKVTTWASSFEGHGGIFFMFGGN
jgi:hypothetical protein